MLDVTDAKKLIKQLEESAFLCSDKCIMTDDYVVIKKTPDMSIKDILNMLHGVEKKNETDEREKLIERLTEERDWIFCDQKIQTIPIFPFACCYNNYDE